MLIVTTILNKENAMILISKEAVFEIIALIYLHSCLKCGGMHSASSCFQFTKNTVKTFVNNRKSVQKFNTPNVYVPKFNMKPPLLGNNPNLK